MNRFKNSKSARISASWSRNDRGTLAFSYHVLLMSTSENSNNSNNNSNNNSSNNNNNNSQVLSASVLVSGATAVTGEYVHEALVEQQRSAVVVGLWLVDLHDDALTRLKRFIRIGRSHLRGRTMCTCEHWKVV